MRSFIGTGVALVTPFTEDNQIDFSALLNLLKHTSCVDYWVVNGTTAESATTAQEEKESLLSFVAKNNPQHKPIMMGVGGNNTEEVVRQLQEMDLTGADAILSVCPYYVKPSQRGIIAHYQAVADASPLPVFLYNVPGRTGVNMTAETVVELSLHPNIVGIKDASGDLVQGMNIANNTSDDFLLISGEDLLTIPLVSVGAVGTICVVGNALPHEYTSVVNHALNGEFTAARKEMAKLVSFNMALFDEGNPVGIKTALEVIGICPNRRVRLPLAPGSEILKARLSDMYAAIRLESRKSVFFGYDGKTAAM